MTDGKPAWITDPTPRTNYPRAKASTLGYGLAFVLHSDDMTGLDLNLCVTDAVLTPGAQAILDLLPDTYAELSPSGHSLRVFCYATVAKGRRFTTHGVALQVCGTGRFVTVTGNRSRIGLRSWRITTPLCALCCPARPDTASASASWIVEGAAVGGHSLGSARCFSRSCCMRSRICPWPEGFSSLNIVNISLSMALIRSPPWFRVLCFPVRLLSASLLFRLMDPHRTWPGCSGTSRDPSPCLALPSDKCHRSVEMVR